MKHTDLVCQGWVLTSAYTCTTQPPSSYRTRWWLQKVPSDPFLRSPTPPKKKPLLISFSRRLVWPFWNFIHTNEIIQLDFLGGLLSLHIVDPAFFGKESVLYKVRFFLNQQETRPKSNLRYKLGHCVYKGMSDTSVPILGVLDQLKVNRAAPTGSRDLWAGAGRLARLLNPQPTPAAVNWAGLSGSPSPYILSPLRHWGSCLLTLPSSLTPTRRIW